MLLEGVEPVELLAVPRAAVLSDQQGDYVYTVDAQNKVQQTRDAAWPVDADVAAVLSGLTEGEMVVAGRHPARAAWPGGARPAPPARRHRSLHTASRDTGR